MKSYLNYWQLSLLLISLLIACSTESNVQPISGGNNSGPNCQDNPDWSIPSCQVFDGGPGKDGIPSVDGPVFFPVTNTEYLSDDDLVIGMTMDGEIKAYPHPVLDWHEIVNDEIGSKAVAITYCPLTGTAIGWDRTVNGKVTTFGVSGLLYNTNLIPYDRETDSNWSQILLKSVEGPQKNERLTTYHLVETTWGTWRKMFPNSMVMSTETDFDRDYGRYPYGDYRTNHNNLIFPISNEDGRFDRKERGMGVLIEDQAKFYNLFDFADAEIVVEDDVFMGEELVVVGSQEHNFISVFHRTLPDGTTLDFSPVDLQGEEIGAIIMQDSEGNDWNLLGIAENGPRAGTRLSAPESFIGYWFAWATFYPDIEVFE